MGQSIRAHIQQNLMLLNRKGLTHACLVQPHVQPGCVLVSQCPEVKAVVLMHNQSLTVMQFCSSHPDASDTPA